MANLTRSLQIGNPNFIPREEGSPSSQWDELLQTIHQETDTIAQVVTSEEIRLATVEASFKELGKATLPLQPSFDILSFSFVTAVCTAPALVPTPASLSRMKPSVSVISSPVYMGRAVF